MKAGDWQDVAEDLLESNRVPFHTRNRKNQHEITVSGHRAVKKLIQVLGPHLVVKKPIAELISGFPTAQPRNRFSLIDRSYLDAVCEAVDRVRMINKGKNRRHKWDGEMIRAFYNK